MDQPNGVYPPKQARSERTQAAILEAARDLIDEGGLGSVTIADVAARTGLTKGAFYARFRDKEALLDALHEEILAENREELETLLGRIRDRGKSLAEAVREMVPVALRVTGRRQKLRHLLALESRGSERARQRTVQVAEELARPLRALFRERSDELGHPDPEIAAGMFAVLFGGLLDWAHLARESGAPVVPPSEDDLAEEIVRALSGYLGLADPSVTRPAESGQPSTSRAGPS